MALNPNIILQGQPVNVLGAVDAGTIAGSRAYDARRTREMHNVLQAYGGGLVQGDQGAMNAIAAFDPQLAMGVRQAQHGMMDSDRRFGFAQAEAQRAQSNADRAYELDREQFEMTRQEAKRAVTEALRQQRREVRAEELAAEAAADETAAAQLANMDEATYNRLGPQIAEARGEQFVPWADRALLIGGLAGGAEAANEYLQRSQEMGAGPTQQYETFEGPDGQQYYFDPANPGAGAQPLAGQVLPQAEPDYQIIDGQYVDRRNPAAGAQNIPGLNVQGDDPSSREEALGLIMETVNPRTGRPYTRVEAIEQSEFAVISRDPVTGEVEVIDIRTGQPWGQMPGQQPQASAQPAIAPSSGLTYGERFEGADTAFGAGGFGRRVANTVADVVGAPMPYAQTDAAQADFGVFREDLLNTISSGYPRQPPSWLLQEIRNLIPEAGSIFQGSQGAINQMESLARTFEQQIEIKEAQLAGEMRPADRAATQQEVTALRTGLAQLGTAISATRGAANMSEEDRALISKYLNTGVSN